MNYREKEGSSQSNLCVTHKIEFSGLFAGKEYELTLLVTNNN